MSVLLTIESGERAGSSLAMAAGGLLRIGRASPAECLITDDAVMSRLHCQLEYDGRTCRLRDLKSSNGTRLNGSFVTESEVNNNDQITAGHTRFTVHLQLGAAQTIESLSPSNCDSPQATLVAALSEEVGMQYAVVDAAHDPVILKTLSEAGLSFQSLFVTSEVDSLAMFVPYLVVISRPSLALYMLLTAGWGKSWSIFIRSEAPASQILDHLRRSLTVRLPDGSTAILRFFDPRVLRKLLPNCTQNQLVQLFGPVDCFVMESENPGQAHVFSLNEGRLHREILLISAEMSIVGCNLKGDKLSVSKPTSKTVYAGSKGLLSLRSDQVALLETINKEHLNQRLLQQLRELYPSEIVAIGEQQMTDLVNYGRVRAMRYGLRDEPEIREYIHLMMQLGHQFDNDLRIPWAANILGRRKKPAEKIALLQAQVIKQRQPSV